MCGAISDQCLACLIFLRENLQSLKEILKRWGNVTALQLRTVISEEHANRAARKT